MLLLYPNNFDTSYLPQFSHSHGVGWRARFFIRSPGLHYLSDLPAGSNQPSYSLKLLFVDDVG
jgi:hypothetical protein